MSKEPGYEVDSDGRAKATISGQRVYSKILSLFKQVNTMSSIGTQCSTRSQLLPVEWPLTSKARQTPKKVEKHIQKTKGIKKRKERRYRKRLGASQPVCPTAVTADQETQTEKKDSGCQRDSYDVEYSTKSVGTNAGIMYGPESPGSTNIFDTLNRDEASWLAQEVHHVNKKVFGAEQTAEKLKNTDLDNKKASLNTLQ